MEHPDVISSLLFSLSCRECAHIPWFKLLPPSSKPAPVDQVFLMYCPSMSVFCSFRDPLIILRPFRHHNHHCHYCVVCVYVRARVYNLKYQFSFSTLSQPKSLSLSTRVPTRLAGSQFPPISLHLPFLHRDILESQGHEHFMWVLEL